MLMHKKSCTRHAADAIQDLPALAMRTWQEVATETAAVYQKAFNHSPN